MAYNGWTNYETWAVALWLTSDEASYHFWCNRAQTYRDLLQSEDRAACPYLTDDEYVRIRLADEMQETLEESNPLIDEASLWSDLLNAALAEVNWQEVARDFADQDWDLRRRGGAS